MRQGFTLLELLIVVVIIGILASIAVPQFFRVAERARASEAVNALGSVRSAQLRYYAEQSKLADALADLDIEMPFLRFFATPNAIDPVYVAGPEIIADVTRNALQNPGFGAYTLSIASDGSITCVGGTNACPRIGYP